MQVSLGNPTEEVSLESLITHALATGALEEDDLARKARAKSALGGIFGRFITLERDVCWGVTNSPKLVSLRIKSSSQFLF